jgi:hypothetical protein
MNDCYVYTLAYPDGTVFYVGKGSGYRIDMHEYEAKQGKKSYKCNVIRQIWRDGGQVVKTKVQENMEEQAAFSLEIDLIRMYGREHLTNVKSGGEGGSWLSDEELHIIATFSLRAERLKWFRQALALEIGHEPSRKEIEEAMRRIAQQSIDNFVKQKIEIEGAIIL